MSPAKRTKDSSQSVADRARKFRARIQLLRLVAERIWHPGFSVVGALELDLVPAASHDRKKAVSIGNPKRIERCHEFGGQRQSENIQINCAVVA